MKTFVVRSVRQLDALTAPASAEIIDEVQALGACTVAELARRAGRPAASLYYHVHKLAAAGLLVPAGEKPGRRRPERVWRLVADRIAVADLARGPAAEARLALAMGAQLRRADREFRSALVAVHRGQAGARGAPDAPLAARMKGRLSRAARRAVQQHLLAIQRIFTEERSRRTGTLHSFTAVYAPIAERSGGAR